MGSFIVLLETDRFAFSNAALSPSHPKLNKARRIPFALVSKQLMPIRHANQWVSAWRLAQSFLQVQSVPTIKKHVDSNV